MTLKEAYLKQYEALNERQKLAVDTLEGPVMVIAGPGTGKTQILSARIGKILLETDTQPGNILCLTYTDAGVVAMRKRLLQFIGPDAYKVHLYTFHAFCHDIIQENLHLFEKRSLDPISELEQMELFRQLIDALPKNNALKRYRGDVYYEADRMKQLFSTMKKEGWTPAFIEERIDAYLASLPDREDYQYKRASGTNKKGDLKEHAIQEETAGMEKLRAAVQQFDAYQALMKARNRYDFDDMINWVIDAFKNNVNLLRRYQEQFLYILVDEYQDTSGTQNRLVQLLIEYWERPNLFVVGDDDQSIYRFQGANIENMEQLWTRYEKDLLTVVLDQNYRSTQPILDISKNLIDLNQQRLVRKIPGLSKELVAAHLSRKALTHPPEIQVCETQRQEMIHLALTIQRLLEEEKIPAQRIAVIFKENKYGSDLAEYLKILSIPVFSKRKLNLLQQPLIQKILCLFDYLVYEWDQPFSGDETLFEILHFDWFGIPPMEIAALSVEVFDKNRSGEKISLRQLLHQKTLAPARDLFSKSVHEGLSHASQILEALIGQVPNQTLQGLLELVIQDTGMLKSLMQRADKNWQLQVLTGFFDFIKDESQRHPEMKLSQLMETITLMRKEGISLPLTEVDGTEKGVSLLTAHGSKGLEFEYVFFAGCVSQFWEKKKDPGKNFKLPDNLYPTTTNQKGDGEEELRRLFYVALTRAEKHLVVSYHELGDDGRQREPSRFIAEMTQDLDLKPLKIRVSEEQLASFRILQLQKSQAPEIEKLESTWVDRLLEKFVMNVTALNNFLKCPLEFYYRNLIRIPSPKNENTEFGSAVHFALEQLFREMKENEGHFPPVEAFLSYFDTYMHRHRESFTATQFERRLEYGHQVLPAYFEKYLDTWNKVAVIEYNIKNVVVEGVPLKGKLDKLEFQGNLVNIVDYKTGDPKKAYAKLKPPHDKNPLGGDYWRQAVFYTLLVNRQASKNWRAESTEFDFIEPDEAKQYIKRKVLVQAADLTTVTQQILASWEKIQRHDFYTGCGKEDCHWCNFVKTHNLAVSLHDLSQEDAEEPDLVNN